MKCNFNITICNINKCNDKLEVIIDLKVRTKRHVVDINEMKIVLFKKRFW